MTETTVLSTVIWLALGLLAVAAVDRLLLWFEARGWINYRRRGLSRGGATYHVLELQSVFNPSTREVMEVKYGEEEHEDESGEPGLPEPRLEVLPPTRLVGLRITMSMAEDRTAALWRAFMPRRKEIDGAVPGALYSVEVYPRGFFEAVDPAATFEKWAAVAVEGDDGAVPDGMAALELSGGLHAVFTYRGPASEGGVAYRYIYGDWLPTSGYVLADRPHLAVMGDKYRGEDPTSEEEIWIPIAQAD